MLKKIKKLWKNWKKKSIKEKIISLCVLFSVLVLASWYNLLPIRFEYKTLRGYYHSYWEWFGFRFFEVEKYVR